MPRFGTTADDLDSLSDPEWPFYASRAVSVELSFLLLDANATNPDSPDACVELFC